MADSGLDLGNIIAIGIAAGALFVSWISYRHNKKSGQIRLAIEEMDRILTKQQRHSEYMTHLFMEGEYSPVRRLNLIDHVLSECEYFGYIISTKQVKDRNTVAYYKPKVNEVLEDMNDSAIKALDGIHKEDLETDFQREIARHTRLTKSVKEYWEVIP